MLPSGNDAALTIAEYLVLVLNLKIREFTFYMNKMNQVLFKTLKNKA